MASSFCDNIDPTSWSPGNLLGSYFCGVSSVLGTVVDPAAETVQHGQDVLGQLGQAGAETVQHGQDKLAEIGEDVTDAASPWNLFGGLAGVTFGGALAVVGIGVVGAVAADVAFTGGTGTRSVALWLAGGRGYGRAR